jgi:hypothetical protein
VQKLYNWKASRDYLAKLIKEVSDHHGGDDPAFLDKHIAEVVTKYADDLGTAIAAYESAHPECQRKAYMALLQPRGGV